MQSLSSLSQGLNEVAVERAQRVANVRQTMSHLREQLQDEMEREKTQKLAKHTAELTSFTESIKNCI